MTLITFILCYVICSMFCGFKQWRCKGVSYFWFAVKELPDVENEVRVAFAICFSPLWLLGAFIRQFVINKWR